MNKTTNAADISRDEFVKGIETVCGTSPWIWDGKTYAEITQELTLEELNRVYEYLGVAASKITADRTYTVMAMSADDLGMLDDGDTYKKKWAALSESQRCMVAERMGELLYDSEAYIRVLMQSLNEVKL